MFIVRITKHKHAVRFNKNNIPTNAQVPIYLALTCLYVSALCGHHQGNIQSEYQYLQVVRMNNTKHDVIMCGCVFKMCVYSVSS